MFKVCSMHVVNDECIRNIICDTTLAAYVWING
jgi:hypothetical protein